MTGSEPASVTAARQLAADSGARDRQNERRTPESPVRRRGAGTTAARRAAGRAIRPLGRPTVDHLDPLVSAGDPAPEEWRLARARPSRPAPRPEPSEDLPPP